MKTRRHTNNKGYRQIKRGKCVDQVKRIARRLGLKYGAPSSASETHSPSASTEPEAPAPQAAHHAP